MKHLIAVFLFFACAIFPARSKAQENLVSSRNGEVLPAQGTIRILLIFVEVEYPGGIDKYASEVGDQWKPGSYPVWADVLFDARVSDRPKGLVTRFYQESSFGKYNVIADILLNPDDPARPFQYKSNGEVNPSNILTEAWQKGFSTKTALPADSFDLWTKSKAGEVKQIRNPEDLLSFDHVMIIARNCNYPGNLAGYASPGNVSGKAPFKTDSYSVFATRNANPMNILLHEYNHLLFGGNNVHCCGGNHAASGPQLFLSFQGGWGMMGAANKSLMTCNAWDRYKLGWKRPEKNFYISAPDTAGNEMNTDFDFSDGRIIDTLIVLRDFVTFGDALRIKLPGIPENEYTQWLWIENHQTESYNGSPFDIFQYQSSGCTDKAFPGLYSFIQVEHNELEGKEAFGGHADFIRPIPASGMYDFEWDDTLVRNNWCVNDKQYYAFSRRVSRQNPLSGNTVVEMPAFDENGDNHLDEKEKRDPAIEIVSGEYRNNLPYLGESEMAFRLEGNKKIGMGTNPSSANALTMLNDNKAINKGQAPDNRSIYLNSISIEIVKEGWPSKGDVLVRIRNGDNVISENVRWCAPRIILSDLPASDEYDLIVENGHRVMIDAGLTPTRIDTAITVNGKNVITEFTHFEMMPNTRMLLKKGAKLDIRNGSVFHISKDAVIVLEKGAKILVGKDAKLVNEGSIIKL